MVLRIKEHRICEDEMRINISYYYYYGINYNILKYLVVIINDNSYEGALWTKY